MSDEGRRYEGDHIEIHDFEAGTVIGKQEVQQAAQQPSFVIVGPVWEALQKAGLDDRELKEARSHLEALDEQLGLPEPDESLLVKAASGLKKLGQKVMTVLESEPMQKAIASATSEVAKRLLSASLGLP